MRVLSGEAVKDPSAVEARVSSKIKGRGGRYKSHLKENEERKLTKE